jgi:hypothetical protein
MRLKRVEIQGFKNLVAPVVLDDLPDVVVLHGDNNVGKSNVLEALEVGFRMFQGDRVGDLREHQILGGLEASEGIVAELLGAPLEELQPFGSEELPSVVVDLELPGRRGGEGSSVFRLAAGWEPDEDRFVLHRSEQRLSGPVGATRSGAVRWPPPEGLSLPPGPPRPLDYLRLPVHRALSGQACRPGQIIPDGLALALYDARASRSRAANRRWAAFVQAAGRFSHLAGPGAVDVVFNRHTGFAELLLRDEHRAIPARLLGTGVQQAWAILGQAVTCGAPMLAIEEPELNLKFEHQLLLREALVELGQGEDPVGPRQLFLSSHSPAFEAGDSVFYHLTAGPEGPTVARRPAAMAPFALPRELGVGPGHVAHLREQIEGASAPPAGLHSLFDS